MLSSKNSHPINVPIIGSNVTANDIVSGGSQRRQAFRPVCPTIPARNANVTNHASKSEVSQPIGDVFSPKSIDIGIKNMAYIILEHNENNDNMKI